MLTSVLCAALLGQSVAWQPLFDGNSLDGWTKRGGEAVYRIENGAIVGETRPNTANTFLCTDKHYADFDLEFEFKVHDELNSGVQIRSNSVLGYQNGRVHGYQVEIDPSERAFTGGLYDESRRGVFLQDLSQNEAGRKAFRKGEWNKYRVLCVGDRIQTWVNGVPCVDARDDLSRSGFIALQVHGVGDRKDPLQVMWRNIRIKDMGNPVESVPANGKQVLGRPGDEKNWTKQGTDEPFGWAYDGSVATVQGGSASLKEPHEDCELYVEFMTDDNGQEGQANGNSGVYLMGRYEIQVLNSAGQAPADNLCGGIYGVKAPDYAMAYPAGVWQNYYIQFKAPRWRGSEKLSNARMTVWHNGTLIHRWVEIPGGTTAGEVETPGPGRLMLQDHGNKVKYRKVWIRRY